MLDVRLTRHARQVRFSASCRLARRAKLSHSAARRGGVELRVNARWHCRQRGRLYLPSSPLRYCDGVTVVLRRRDVGLRVTLRRELDLVRGYCTAIERQQDKRGRNSTLRSGRDRRPLAAAPERRHIGGTSTSASRSELRRSHAAPSPSRSAISLRSSERGGRRDPRVSHRYAAT